MLGLQFLKLNKFSKTINIPVAWFTETQMQPLKFLIYLLSSLVKWYNPLLKHTSPRMCWARFGWIWSSGLWSKLFSNIKLFPLFQHYLTLEKSVFPNLNKHPRMLYIKFRIDPLVLKKKRFKSKQWMLAFPIISLEQRHDPRFEESILLLIQECVVPSSVEISPVILGEMKIDVSLLFYNYMYLPWRRMWLLIWKKNNTHRCFLPKSKNNKPQNGPYFHENLTATSQTKLWILWRHNSKCVVYVILLDVCTYYLKMMIFGTFIQNFSLITLVEENKNSDSGKEMKNAQFNVVLTLFDECGHGEISSIRYLTYISYASINDSFDIYKMDLSLYNIQKWQNIL